jgi:hypothetical protein
MYFSDGSAAQHKNRNNFIIVYNEQYFGLSAEWHFFTSSRGKGPADEIGGTVRRLAGCRGISTECVQ